MRDDEQADDREHGGDRHARRAAGRTGRGRGGAAAPAWRRRARGHAAPLPAGTAASTVTGVAPALPGGAGEDLGRARDARRTPRRRGSRAGASRARRTCGWRGGRRRRPGRPRRPRRARSGRPNAIPSSDVALPAEHELGVAAVGGADALDGQPEDGDERLRVAGPARREPREVAVQAVVDVRRPAARGPPGAAAARPPGRRGRRRGEEPLDERVPALQRELEPGRRGVAAVPDEQVAAGRRAHGRGSGARRPGTRRGPRRRQAPVVPTIAGRPVSSARRPATRPMIPTGHGPVASSAAASGPPAIRIPVSAGRGRVEPAPAGPAPAPGRAGRTRPAPRRSALRMRSRAGGVRRLEDRGELGRLLRRRGEQQPGGVEGLPHPAGGVEPGREHEARRSRGPPRPGATPACASSAAMPGRGAVRIRSSPSCAIDRFSPSTGDDVRHRPDRREVRELAAPPPPRPARSPSSSRATVNATPLPRQPAVRVGRVGALRVDEGDGRGQHLGQVVVVGDDHVDPAARGRGDLRDARGPGVDGHDQRDPPSRGRRLDRGQSRGRGPPRAGDGTYGDGVDAQAAEREHELGEPGQAVRIEVAEHHDPLAARRRARRMRSTSAVRVGQQAGGRSGRPRPGRGSAPRPPGRAIPRRARTVAAKVPRPCARAAARSSGSSRRGSGKTQR